MHAPVAKMASGFEMDQIHLTETPPSVFKKKDETLSYFGTFISPETEDAFRVSVLKMDTYHARIILIVSVLLSLGYVSNDYLLYGTGTGFFVLIAARGVVIVGSIAVWFLLKTSSTQKWERYMFGWVIVLTLHCVYLVSTRPAGTLGVVVSNLLVLMVCYFLVPIRLGYQLVAAAILTFGHSLVALWIDPILDPIFRNSLVFVLIAANAIGFFSSRQLNFWKRVQFAIRRQLYDSEIHYRTLIEASGSLVFTLMPDRIVEYAAKIGNDTTGLSGTRMKPDQWAKMIHQEDRKLTAKIFTKGIETGQHFEVVSRLLQCDGDYRWVLTRMVPLENESGQIEKWIGTSTDIHEHWMVKLELREMNDRLAESIGRVSQLEEILPICSFCKKIKDENSEWQPLEEYISSRSETRFSHGICNSCGTEHYGELGQKIFGTSS
jgi:PAS domain S-box-containing protein